MKYSFNDIVKEEIYKDCSLMLVTGPYGIFNNMVIDQLRTLAVGEELESENAEELYNEFGLTDDDDGMKSQSSIDINTFFTVCYIPNVSGRWFCTADLSVMNKKQIEKMEDYMKSPSKYSTLVVYATEFKDYRYYLRDKFIQNSRESHLITLSFPNKKMLVDIVKGLFEQRGLQVEQRAAELFVMRLSNSYDDYQEVIDNIRLKRGGNKLTYDEMLEDLKGVENYLLDDFLEKLLVPATNPSPNANKRMYRISNSLIAEFGAQKLVQKLKYKIDDYLEFRLAINKGIIPIKVKYDISEAKKKLGEEHRLYKISDFSFRRMAYVASKTSLNDWLYMRLIVNNASNRGGSEVEFERVIYSLINRSNLPDIRLNNDIGLENSLSPELDLLNNTVYIEPNEIQELLSRRAIKRLSEDSPELYDELSKDSRYTSNESLWEKVRNLEAKINFIEES